MKALPPAQNDMNANPTLRAFVNRVWMDRQARSSEKVRRKSLDRMGGEFGSVTDVVRYAPGGRPRVHPHPVGEEIPVRSGVFSDESGNYLTGSGLLNSEGAVHVPYSVSGRESMGQYPDAGRARRRQSAYAMATWCAGIDVSGLSLLPCYREIGLPEYATLARLVSATSLSRLTFPSSVECFVLEGSLRVAGGAPYGPGAWRLVGVAPAQRAYTAQRVGCVVLSTPEPVLWRYLRAI